MANGNSVVLDLTNYRDSVGARVPEGTYRVIVDDTELTKSKAGNEMINVWYKIIGGDYDGSTLTDRFPLTEKALFRVVQFLNAIGMKTPKKRLQLNLDQMRGKVLEVKVEDGDPYNGRVRSEIREFSRATKSQTASAGATDLEDTSDDEDVVEDVSNGGEDQSAPDVTPEETASVEATHEQDESETNDDADVDLDDLEEI